MLETSCLFNSHQSAYIIVIFVHLHLTLQEDFFILMRHSIFRPMKTCGRGVSGRVAYTVFVR